MRLLKATKDCLREIYDNVKPKHDNLDMDWLYMFLENRLKRLEEDLANEFNAR